MTNKRSVLKRFITQMKNLQKLFVQLFAILVRHGQNTEQKYPIANNRFEIIERYVKGKDVLDCGCVTHNVRDKEWRKKWWLHDKIVEKSKYCLGIDVEKAEIEKLRKEGYNVKCCDVEKMELNRKFDAIIAGELIEHLSNPGLFLDGVRVHLKKNGHFILTTPNPFCFGFVSRSLLGLINISHSQHTCFFDTVVIKHLLERHGFLVEEISWCRSAYPHAPSNLILWIRKDFAPTIIVVARLNKEEEVS